MYRLFMNDNAMQPAELLRSRLADMLRLLDEHGLTLAAAWLTMAIDAIPVGDRVPPTMEFEHLELAVRR